MLVFSMDSRESFEEVIRLREQILETKLSASSSSGRSKKNQPKVPMVIAGNKCDREAKYVVRLHPRLISITKSTSLCCSFTSELRWKLYQEVEATKF